MLVKKPTCKRLPKIDKSTIQRPPADVGKTTLEEKVQFTNSNPTAEEKIESGSRFDIFANEAENELNSERFVHLDDQDSCNFGEILDDICQISNNPSLHQIPPRNISFQLGTKKQVKKGSTPFVSKVKHTGDILQKKKPQEKLTSIILQIP